MSGVISSIFGGGKDNSAEMLKAQQRRTLAELASQQAQIDMAGASGGGGRRGSQMLTYLNRGGDVLGGSSKFGSA